MRLKLLEFQSLKGDSKLFYVFFNCSIRHLQHNHSAVKNLQLSIHLDKNQQSVQENKILWSGTEGPDFSSLPSWHFLGYQVRCYEERNAFGWHLRQGLVGDADNIVQIRCSKPAELCQVSPHQQSTSWRFPACNELQGEHEHCQWSMLERETEWW